MSSLGEVFIQLRKRHMFQITVGYLAVGWFCVEITGFLVDNYDLSRRMIDFALLIAAIGFPAVLTIGWYHGDSGHQEMRGSEIAILLSLALIGAGGAFWLTTREAGSMSEGFPFSGSIAGVDAGTAVTPNVQPVSLDGDLGRTSGDLGRMSIAVFPFTNNVADEELSWLGSGLADMLTTNFAQMPELTIVGRQRLFDVMIESGHAESDEIPDNIATDLAERTGARLMVRGTIIGTADDLAIDAQLIEIQSGTVVAAERARGSDVFALVDTLSARMANHMWEGQPLELANNAPLSRVATHDLEAYRAFHEGLAAERESDRDMAMKSFERAVEIDSGFSVALLRLAAHEGDESPRKVELVRRALKSLAAIPEQFRTGRIDWESGDSAAIAIQVDSIVTEVLSASGVRLTMPPEMRRRPPRSAPEPRDSTDRRDPNNWPDH